MGWVSLAPKSWNLSLENTRKSRPKVRKWGQIIVQSRFGRPKNLAKNSNATEKRRPFHNPPFLGYHFGPRFGTRDSFFGGTQLFEGSSFGFRFGVRFGIHFVSENSSRRRPKRQEKEQKAREAKMWFGYGRRYTGGTWGGMKKMRKPRKNREKASSEVGACFGPRFGTQNGIALEPE